MAEPTPAADSTEQTRQKAMLEPVYRFSLSWKAPNGQFFVGDFAHRVPTIGQQMAIDQAMGRHVAMSGGRLEGEARDTAVSICHLDPTLIERPSWAKDLRALPYLDLLYAIAREAMAHCETFCVATGGQGTGGQVDEGPAGAAAPVVQPKVQPAA